WRLVDDDAGRLLPLRLAGPDDLGGLPQVRNHALPRPHTGPRATRPVGLAGPGPVAPGIPPAFRIPPTSLGGPAGPERERSRALARRHVGRRARSGPRLGAHPQVGRPGRPAHPTGRSAGPRGPRVRGGGARAPWAPGALDARSRDRRRRAGARGAERLPARRRVARGSRMGRAHRVDARARARVRAPGPDARRSPDPRGGRRPRRVGAPRRGGRGRAVGPPPRRVSEQSRPCGRLLSLGLDGQLTYFTRASHGHVGIYYVGVDAAHRALFGYGMLDVSPASDFLVTPVETGDPRALALASRRTVLYWRGDGGPVPLGTGRRGLHVERTLAWSPDASEAIVAGRLGGSRGVYVVDAGPGLTERSPRLVVAAGKRVGATFAPDGTAYLAIGGGLFASSGPELASAAGSSSTGTALVSIRLPDGAPRPSGPIAWIP